MQVIGDSTQVFVLISDGSCSEGPSAALPQLARFFLSPMAECSVYFFRSPKRWKVNEQLWIFSTSTLAGDGGGALRADHEVGFFLWLTGIWSGRSGMLAICKGPPWLEFWEFSSGGRKLHLASNTQAKNFHHIFSSTDNQTPIRPWSFPS